MAQPSRSASVRACRIAAVAPGSRGEGPTYAWSRDSRPDRSRHRAEKSAGARSATPVHAIGKQGEAVAWRRRGGSKWERTVRRPTHCGAETAAEKLNRIRAKTRLDVPRRDGMVPAPFTCGRARRPGAFLCETGAARPQGVKTMQLAISRELYAYWDALRAGRSAPERNDIEPGAIRGVLADTFVLDFDPQSGFPFRIAGSRANALFGTELRGLSFLELWREGDRQTIKAVLQRVANDAEPTVLRAEARPPGTQFAPDRDDFAAASASRLDAFADPRRRRRRGRAVLGRPHRRRPGATDLGQRAERRETARGRRNPAGGERLVSPQDALVARASLWLARQPANLSSLHRRSSQSALVRRAAQCAASRRDCPERCEGTASAREAASWTILRDAMLRVAPQDEDGDLAPAVVAINLGGAVSASIRFNPPRYWRDFST